MKKVSFIVLRAFTVLSTIFWAACCIPLVGFCVGMFCDDCLGMRTWQFVLLIAAAPVVGLLTAALFGKTLPRLDLILSTLLPPAFVGAMYGTVNMAQWSGFALATVCSYASGALCLAAGIAAAVYFVRNGRKNGAVSR
ncbi:MAG: hypothetical protein IJL26_11560 [Clostridia bacterium]|nr:hypothetical protein [Clostridia bacterium]